MTDSIAGLAGGCAGVLVGHPFDTVKVKLQTQDHRNPLYRGTWDCFTQTARKHGVRGVYRGMASPLMGVGGINAVIFGVHGAVTRQCQDPDALSSHLIGGVTAGVVQAFICSPVELTKTRLQLQADAIGSGSSATARYKGPMHCLKEIYRAEGVKGVFRGQMVTIAREVPAFGTYFLSFEWMVRKMQGTDSKAGSAAILMAGGTAGTLSWLVSHPIDVVKTRIQSDGAFGPARYSGLLDCCRQTINEEGIRGFTRGLNSTLLRAFPTNAATFLVAKSMMDHFSTEGGELDTINIEEAATNTKNLIMAEISLTGTFIRQAARVTKEVYHNQQIALRNLKENHLANFIPLIQAISRNSYTYLTEHLHMNDNITNLDVSSVDDFTQQALQEIFQCPTQKAALQKLYGKLLPFGTGSISYGQELAKTALISHQILSTAL